MDRHSSSPPEVDEESETFLSGKERRESSDTDNGLIASSSPALYTDFYQAWCRKRSLILMAIGVGVAVIGFCGMYYRMSEGMSEDGRKEEATPASEKWGGTPQIVNEWSEEDLHWRAYSWTAPDIDETLKRMLSNLSSVCSCKTKFSRHTLSSPRTARYSTRMIPGQGIGCSRRGQSLRVR